jgi:hypothetical protein
MLILINNYGKHTHWLFIKGHIHPDNSLFGAARSRHLIAPAIGLTPAVLSDY